jgi:trehalose 6-phosphate synthase
LKPVNLTQEEEDKYYYGFANEILWPLFHDLLQRCNFDPEYWSAYCRVNDKFAQVIKDHLTGDDFVWVHDYHLMLVAQSLRRLGVRSRTAFFLHTPFPPLDVFIKLPWRYQFLEALLHYGLIGFQTLRDRRNFVQCVRTLIKDARVQGKGQVLDLSCGRHRLRLGAFPISIDYKEFADLAKSDEVGARAKVLDGHLPGQRIILGVDRLDYTKGIPERLKAFMSTLINHPELREKVVLVQVVVPSRRRIGEYQDLKAEIEGLVSRINGHFTCSGWVPIHYLFRNLERTELVAYYRTAEVGLITPLKDGMNLVAKEFCASSLEEDSVLVLSEFTGVAAQFQKAALLVNPHDQEGVAQAIHQALEMAPEERRKRMKKLRSTVRRSDIYRWVNSFLKASIAKRLDSFPPVADYQPQIELGRVNEPDHQTRSDAARR